MTSISCPVYRLYDTVVLGVRAVFFQRSDYYVVFSDLSGKILYDIAMNADAQFRFLMKELKEFRFVEG